MDPYVCAGKHRQHGSERRTVARRLVAVGPKGSPRLRAAARARARVDACAHDGRGLRGGHAWALWALTMSDLTVVVHYWMLVVPPFARAFPLKFSDLHPYALYPLVAVPIATLLGWLSLR